MKKLFLFLNLITILLTSHYAFAQCNVSEPVIFVDGVETHDGQIIEVCTDQWINLEGSGPNVDNGETAVWSGSVGLVSTTPSEAITFYFLGDYDATWTFKSSTPGCNQISRTVTFRAKDVPPPPVITGRTEVCEDSEESYSLHPVARAEEYRWTVSGSNSIVSGQGSKDVTVAFSTESSSSETSTPVQIEVTANNQCGSSFPATLNVEKSNCSVVGFNSELAENSYKLYPNPFTTSFTLTGIQDFQKIEVYNISGQLVESYASKNNLGLTLPKGNYVLKIQTASEIVYKKIMKR